MTDEDGAAVDRFKDLAALRTAHLSMLSGQTAKGGRPEPIEASVIHAFLAKAEATGAVIADPDDRGVAQRILDYWSADLVSGERERSEDVETLTLAPFEGTADQADIDPWASSASTYRPYQKTEEPRNPYSKEQARQYIRFSSVARQWRDTGSDAYLLTDDALQDALEFKQDPDIAKLIDASIAAERQSEKRKSRVKNVVIALLVGLVCLAGWQSWNAIEAGKIARKEAEEAKTQRDVAAVAQVQALLAIEAENKAQQKLADEQVEEAKAQAKAREEAAKKLAEALDLANKQQEAANKRLAELTARQRLLDVAIGLIVDKLVTWNISLVDVPAEIREDVLARLAARVRAEEVRLADMAPDLAGVVRELVPEATQTAFDRALDGFQDGLEAMPGPETLLPQLGDRLRAAAWEGGAQVRYLHYSLVLDAEKRSAIYAAANLDRTQRAVLPAGSSLLDLDPRLAASIQPDPAWFGGKDQAAARLVDRNDIAWGKEGSDASMVDLMVNVYPNAVPVAPALAAGWGAVSEWVQTDHNPLASRVIILSGPIPPRGGDSGAPAAALWKIAISVEEQPPQKQYVPSGALVVDAFIVDGLRAADGSGPEHYRSTVAEIAARTGLTFPPEVERGDRGASLLQRTRGDELAEAVPGIDGPVAAERKALTQALVTGLRDGALGDADQAKVTAALLAFLTEEPRPSSTGRFNGLYVLSQVPSETWDRPDWLHLKAGARYFAGLADMEARTLVGRSAEQVRELVAKLKAGVGLDRKPAQTVYIQFAGYTRERAQGLRDSLRRLGWTVPGEERTGKADRLQQVRYNPDVPEDVAAARLLVADIAAAGWPGVEAVPVKIIKPGVLEIWVGLR